MTKPAVRHALDDILTEAELARVTRVPSRARDSFNKRIEVLRSAGIHYWICGDGTIATTWHHVHNARTNDPVKKPDEIDNKTPNFGAMR